MSEDTQKRTCRACDASYEYPGHQSLATRTHCQECVQIPPAVRRVFEQQRRRLDRLERALAALRQERG